MTARGWRVARRATRSATQTGGSLTTDNDAPPKSPSQRGAFPLPPAGLVDGVPPFERPGALPRRFLTTARAVLRAPRAFFIHLSRAGAPGTSWFGFFCLLVGNAGTAAWTLFALPSMVSVLRSQAALAGAEGATLADNADQIAALEPELWLRLLLAPVLAFVTLHLLASVLHVCCKAFAPLQGRSDATPRYEATYRFVAYAQAPHLLALVPVVGAFSPVLTAVLSALALGKLHHLRPLALVGAVVFPTLFVSSLLSFVLRLLSSVLAGHFGFEPPLPP